MNNLTKPVICVLSVIAVTHGILLEGCSSIDPSIISDAADTDAAADSAHRHDAAASHQDAVADHSEQQETQAPEADVMDSSLDATQDAKQPPPKLQQKTLIGTLKWTVSFDESAKAAGAIDCVYERTYTAAEDRSVPWICPDCKVMFNAQVEMTKGLNDCYKAFISKTDPLKNEWIGFDNNHLRRTPYAIIPATKLGQLSMTESGFTSTHQVNDQTSDILNQGKFSFTIEGNFKLATQQGDPMNGWTPPDTYQCGWGKASPPAYTGDYTFAKGTILPDGILRDNCGEPFRLHDAKGDYLVLIAAARDCPACKQMAGGDATFMSTMASKGIAVKTITLLQKSLDTIAEEPTQMQLTAWATHYKIASPVLAERGLGVFLLLQKYSDQLALPTWIVVGPDLKILNFGTGADWATITQTITNHNSS